VRFNFRIAQEETNNLLRRIFRPRLGRLCGLVWSKITGQVPTAQSYFCSDYPELAMRSNFDATFCPPERVSLDFSGHGLHFTNLSNRRDPPRINARWDPL